MSTGNRSVRQSVNLSARVARRVKLLAQSSGTSTSRMIAELIESGLDQREQEKKHFFELADRLARSRDLEEQKELKGACSNDLRGVMPKIRWSGYSLPSATAWQATSAMMLGCSVRQRSLA